MHLKIALLLLFFTLVGFLSAFSQSYEFVRVAAPQQEQPDQHEDDAAEELHEAAEAHTTAPPWTVIPFALLLIMIATGPLFYEHFWHKNYPIVAVLLAVLVVCYYLFILHNQHGPVHALAEYMQFIALLFFTLHCFRRHSHPG